MYFKELFQPPKSKNLANLRRLLLVQDIDIIHGKQWFIVLMLNEWPRASLM